ncbi:hypothetical protein Misp03_36460 [Microbispora sp. NBRC 16548]|nr:hypothetical protein Misp03_36460 [Microbispora sp. NBRC 16548]
MELGLITLDGEPAGARTGNSSASPGRPRRDRQADGRSREDEPVTKTDIRRAMTTVDAWNAEHPIGTAVRYWTGFREGPGKISNTRTVAQLIAGQSPVVWVEGEGSCISLTHVEPVDEELRAAYEADRRAVAECAARPGGHAWLVEAEPGEEPYLTCADCPATGDDLYPDLDMLLDWAQDIGGTRVQFGRALPGDAVPYSIPVAVELEDVVSPAGPWGPAEVLRTNVLITYREDGAG